MRNPVYTKALIRLLLSLPLLVLLFGGAALPSLFAWSRLYAPNWTETFSSLSQNMWAVECCAAFLLLCVHYPVYRRGFEELRLRRPGTSTLLALSALLSFAVGFLPLVLDWTAGLFTESPLYASAMSALMAFGAVGWEFPSYFHLVGLWSLFFALGDFLRARAALLLARAAGSDAPMPEDEIYKSLIPFPVHVAVLALLLAVLCGAVWALLGVSLPFAFFFGLFLLLSAAPCALPLAEAVPLWIGAALLKERGASLRTFRAVETAALSDVLVLGKPDILTKGEPQITDIIPEGIMLKAFMSLAAAAESGSRHPVAKVISEHAIRLRAKYGRIAAFNESPGEGAEVLMNGAPIRIGQRAWIESQGVRISANLLTKDDQLAEKGKTILYVSNGPNAKGIIAYEYDLDDEAAQAVRALEKQGVGTILMIGEGARTAKALAKRLGVPNYRHSIRAVDLMREIQLLQAHGKNVALFANLPEDSAAMQQADCPVLPLFEKSGDSSPINQGGHNGQKEQDDAPKTMEMEFPATDDNAKDISAAATTLPAVIVRNLSALPPVRELLRDLLASARQNTLFAFLGPLLILPASSGILLTLGYPFPAPWLVAMAALPGLAAAIISAVRMGRQLAVVSPKTANPKKEDLPHEP